MRKISNLIQSFDFSKDFLTTWIYRPPKSKESSNGASAQNIICSNIIQRNINKKWKKKYNHNAQLCVRGHMTFALYAIHET